MVQLKLFYNYLTLGMIVFFLIDLKTGFESIWHKQFNLIAILCVIINYIIIILNHHGLLCDSIGVFWIFNGSVFVTSLMILTSGIHHGIFKK